MKNLTPLILMTLHLFQGKKGRCGVASVFFALLLGMFVQSCSGSTYSFKAFSFPPGSLPHENDWQYSGRVIVSSREAGPLTKVSEKKVKIRVFDRNNKTLLVDVLHFRSADIEATIAWQNFEEIDIELREVGNQYAEDQYNKALFAGGPRQLASLRYLFNTNTRRFGRL